MVGFSAGSLRCLRPSSRTLSTQSAVQETTHFPCTRLDSAAAIRGSNSTASRFLHFCRMRTDRLPG